MSLGHKIKNNSDTLAHIKREVQMDVGCDSSHDCPAAISGSDSSRSQTKTNADSAVPSCSPRSPTSSANSQNTPHSPSLEESKASLYSLTASDMMFQIRDTTTGVSYDIRRGVPSITDQLTKLGREPPKGAVWAEWWGQKRDRNFDLLSASERGDLSQVSDLLDTKRHGDLAADVNARGLEDFTALHYAANEEHAEIVRFLITQGANVNAATVSLQTPLHLAACRGNCEIVQLLVHAKADVNARDKDGNTPIHVLAEFGHHQALGWALEHGGGRADVKNSLGQTPGDVAGSLETRRMLVAQQPGYARTAVGGIVMHNSRADTIKELMFRSRLVAASAESRPTTSPTKRVEILPTSGAGAATLVCPEDFIPVQLLGRGAFGEVYLARFVPTGRFYAVKVLSKQHIAKQNLLKYVRTERNVLRYSRHPFIVGIEFAFQNPESLFLVLEYCPGYTRLLRSRFA